MERSEAGEGVVGACGWGLLGFEDKVWVEFGEVFVEREDFLVGFFRGGVGKDVDEVNFVIFV